MRAAVLALAWLASACTQMGTERIAGWPSDMKVSEHYVSNKAMRDRCAKYVGFFDSPEACAEWDLRTRKCSIYYSADFPPGEWVKEHEREHCAGFKHAGER